MKYRLMVLLAPIFLLFGCTDDKVPVKNIPPQLHAEALRVQDTKNVEGNPNGPVTLVEFSDYQCVYCRAMAPQLKQQILHNPSLRVVHVEAPLFGGVSIVAAKAAIAAQDQDRYLAFHDAMMQTKLPLTEDAIWETAAAVGLDVDKLKEQMKSESVTRAFERDQALLKTLGIDGIPTYALGYTTRAEGAISFVTSKPKAFNKFLQSFIESE